MPVQLADTLLTLAASIDGDGGSAVCRTLASLLRDAAPFDAGELVLRQAEGFHRFPLATDERPLAGDDIVAHVLANGPRRLDDQRDLDAFPATRDLMAQSGLKSALILPLRASSSGVLIVARRHGWAFVGASLHFLGPLAAMAGLALDRSLALTALGHPAALEAGADDERRDTLRHEGATLIGELQRLRAQSAANIGEIESLRSALAVARDELADSRGATIAAQSALDQAVGRCHELQARLDRREPPATTGGGGGESSEPVAAPVFAKDEGTPTEPSEPSAEKEDAEDGPVAADTVVVSTAAESTIAAASDATSAAPAEAAVVAPAGPAEADIVATPAAAIVASADATPAGPQLAPPASPPASSRRARRRRRGAFEPPGGPGAA